MRPQQNPGSPTTPPPGPSRGARPLLSPSFSRRAFPAAASAAVVSERPSVTLDEWWLARVEGHGKIAVAGFFERNREVREFAAALISKRYEPSTLETENGIVVFLHGFFNTERTLQNGYTIEACEKFCIGFPHWWEKWNLLYPKMMSSQTVSQPSSSTTSNSREDSNVPSASTVECTNDESKVVTNNTSRINKGRQKTPVASLKSHGCLKKPKRIASHDKAVPGEATDEQASKKGKKPVGPSRKQQSAFRKLQHATRSPNIKSPIPYDNKYQLTRGMSRSASVYRPEYLNLKKTRSGRVVVPALDSGCQNIVYDQDGSISAITGLDLRPPLKGNTSKNYGKKK